MKRTYTGDFMTDVADEVAWSRKEFAEFNSPHEALAVIEEEVEEFRREVYQRPERRSPGQMYQELVQIAAMCYCAANECPGASV